MTPSSVATPINKPAQDGSLGGTAGHKVSLGARRRLGKGHQLIRPERPRKIGPGLQRSSLEDGAELRWLFTEN